MISTTKSVQGGWKPNMWNNYPQHMMGKVRQLPDVKWIVPPKPARPELSEKKKERDPFKQKLNAEDMDAYLQSHMD